MRETFQVRSIGVLHTKFNSQKGTPIQSGSAQSEKGVIEVFPEFVQGLDDLDGFSRLWVLYRFNRIPGESLKVVPYLDTRTRGVFSTRSPRRPNLLGMAVVKIDEIKDGRISISGVDMLDKTPVVDIKPYIPDFDHHEASKIGWYAESARKSQKVLADDRFARHESISYFGGRIVALNLSAGVGTAKKAVLSCKFSAGSGMEGDGHSGTVRQVSLLMGEDIDSYNAEHEPKAGPGDFAENIVTWGLDLLKAQVGDEIRIGDAVLEVTQIGKEALPQHYSFNGNRLLPTRGVFCRIISNGVARPGDMIVLRKNAAE